MNSFVLIFAHVGVRRIVRVQFVALASQTKIYEMSTSDGKEREQEGIPAVLEHLQQGLKDKMKREDENRQSLLSLLISGHKRALLVPARFELKQDHGLQKTSIMHRSESA